LLDKLTQQQRMLLAVVLSLIFFIFYDKYFVPKPSPKDINSTKTTQQISVTSQPEDKAISKAPSIQNSSKVVTKAPVSRAKVLVNIESKNYKLTIDNLGRISSFVLTSPRFKDSDGNSANLIKNSASLKPLEIRFSDNSINSEAFLTDYTTNTSTLTIDKDEQNIVVLTQKLSELTVTKSITFRENGTYSVDIKLSKPSEFFITNGSRPTAAEDPFVFSGVVALKPDSSLEMIEDGDSDSNVFISHAGFLASVDKYYTTAFYDFKDGLNVVISSDKDSNPESFIQSKTDIKLSGYIGDKDYKKLASLDERLTDIREYGFFTFISKPMFLFLQYLFDMIGNWGWTIVVATIIIKLFLYPLTYKGMVSMNKLKELAPQIKALQAEHKKNPQKMNAKMMELYKKHGANPMGGCLPMLMQIPVFFAIYRVLLNSPELKNATWTAWITDLSAMDPYFILPILMGATMFWQQHITPTNFTDPMQEKIMKFLPIIFTFFFMTFPSGLTLYWFINNLFSVGQQYYVNSLFAKNKQGASSEKS
jgi:YidC/Oxa1 family membrane protein insertase